jgi:hypothetical protein
MGGLEVSLGHKQAWLPATPMSGLPSEVDIAVKAKPKIQATAALFGGRDDGR